MKPNTISQRRRYLMIAGLAGAAVPATSLSALCTGDEPTHDAAGTVSIARGDTLLVSGRIVDAGCKPIAGARVELLLQPHAEQTSALTDGDGRFVLTGTSTRATKHADYRVTHDAHSARVARVHFARRSRAARPDVAALQRDEAGIWRTTIGVTLA
ncbi:MAG: Carboxypeptidase regulatory-like domain [Betaproteobacteria bacterium]|nr:Carboxypeptidase regulatory-like domain [Betaproteobacteria bacterium]